MYKKLNNREGQSLFAILIPLSGLVLFGWLAIVVFSGKSAHADLLVRTFVHQFSSPPLTEIMKVFSFFGSTGVLSALTVLAVVLLRRSHLVSSALLLAVTVVGAVPMYLGLKDAFHRPRPVPFFGAHLHDYSFPSGHALTSLCFYGALALVLSERVQKARFRVCIWVVAVLLSLLIGLSRIYLGVHYPSDVAAGYCAAIFWIGAIRLLDQTLGCPPESVKAENVACYPEQDRGYAP